jgi:hypothetical protein
MTIVEKRRQRDFIDLVFGTQDFLRTLSYREFVTSFVLALLLLSCQSILNYYSNEDWVESNAGTIRITLFVALAPINHFFYRLEHNRSNNFMGRGIHDCIYILLVVLLITLKGLYYGYRISVGADNIVSLLGFLFFVAIMVVAFELAVALLKRFLALFRWQIL